MMKELENVNSFQELLEKSDAILVYFSHDHCNVCKVLKPKIEDLCKEQYPQMDLIYVNVEKIPELAAQNSIFTVPVVVGFFGGRESFRKARSFSLDELAQQINRPYQIIFE